MMEYVLVFLVLLAGAMAFYLIYERYFTKPQKSVSTLYMEALRNLLDGDQVAAFSKLRQVVAEDSTNIDAYLRLGQILRENKKPERALQVHKDLTLRGNLSVREKSAILKQLALDYIALKDTDMAEAALRELIELNPQNLWAHGQLLELQKKAEKWEDAYETATKILKLESNRSKKPLAVFKYRQGEQLFKRKEYHKARTLFKEAISLDPTFVPAYLAIGDSYCEEKREEDAVNFWIKLTEAVPDQGHRAIDRLKKTLFELGRFGELAQICENILKSSPKNIEARFTLAEFYEKKGDLATAEEILTQIVEDFPDDLKSIMELIRLYLEKGDTRKINELFRSLEQRREKLQRRAQHDHVEAGLTSVSS